MAVGVSTCQPLLVDSCGSPQAVRGPLRRSELRPHDRCTAPETAKISTGQGQGGTVEAKAVQHSRPSGQWLQSTGMAKKAQVSNVSMNPCKAEHSMLLVTG